MYAKAAAEQWDGWQKFRAVEVLSCADPQAAWEK